MYISISWGIWVTVVMLLVCLSAMMLSSRLTLPVLRALPIFAASLIGQAVFNQFDGLGEILSNVLGVGSVAIVFLVFLTARQKDSRTIN